MRTPKTLYKFRKFDTYCLGMIERLQVFYSDPRDFNDPLDCDPGIGYTNSIPTIEKVLNSFYLSGSSIGEEAAERRIAEIKYNLTHPDYNDSSASELRRYYRNSLLLEIKRELAKSFGRTGVLSLSSRWNNVLMWSHYGDNHSGICIGYDGQKHRSEYLDKVDYSLPRRIPFELIKKWRLSNHEESGAQVKKHFFFAKSGSWKYESEWRALKNATDSGQTGIGVNVSPFDIKEIVFGLNCHISIIAATMHIHRGNTKIKYYRIRTKGKTFDLSRTKLDPSEYLAGSPAESLRSLLVGFESVDVDST